MPVIPFKNRRLQSSFPSIYVCIISMKEIKQSGANSKRSSTKTQYECLSNQTRDTEGVSYAV